MDEKESKEYNRFTWLKDHPEDQWIDDENQAVRLRGYEDDDIRQLFAAICLKACIDYKQATMGKKIGTKYPEQVIEECHRFFQSEMFQYFVNRISVEEIEKTIRLTPPGAIHSLWRKSENAETPKNVI